MVSNSQILSRDVGVGIVGQGFVGLPLAASAPWCSPWRIGHFLKSPFSLYNKFSDQSTGPGKVVDVKKSLDRDAVTACGMLYWSR